MKVEALRERRIKLRCSQYMVAKIAGVSRNRLSLVECGYIEAGTEELRKLHFALSKIEAELRKTPLLRRRHGLPIGEADQ